MFQIIIDLSSDPLMIYLESADTHTLITWEPWAFSDLISFPLMLQILMDLSSDPLMIYYESADIHTLFTEWLWAFSID